MSATVNDGPQAYKLVLKMVLFVLFESTDCSTVNIMLMVIHSTTGGITSCYAIVKYSSLHKKWTAKASPHELVFIIYQGLLE